MTATSAEPAPAPSVAAVQAAAPAPEAVPTSAAQQVAPPAQLSAPPVAADTPVVTRPVGALAAAQPEQAAPRGPPVDDTTPR